MSNATMIFDLDDLNGFSLAVTFQIVPPKIKLFFYNCLFHQHTFLNKMASKLDTLTVNLSSAPYQRAFTTTTSPVVLFSVLDHYLRRDDPQTKVVGALLGVRSLDGTEVEIRNAFPLIYTTADNTIDKEHYRSMYELHRRVNPEEVVLGWYTAGADLTAACTPVHAFFSEDAAPFQPIHVTVDTEALFKSSDMGLRAYARYCVK